MQHDNVTICSQIEQQCQTGNMTKTAAVVAGLLCHSGYNKFALFYLAVGIQSMPRSTWGVVLVFVRFSPWCCHKTKAKKFASQARQDNKPLWQHKCQIQWDDNTPLAAACTYTDRKSYHLTVTTIFIIPHYTTRYWCFDTLRDSCRWMPAAQSCSMANAVVVRMTSTKKNTDLLDCGLKLANPI